MKTLLAILLLPLTCLSQSVFLFGSADQVKQPRWDDSFVPPLSTRTGATAPSFDPFLAAGGLYMFTFQPDTVNDQVYFSLQMSHAWMLGTAISPHVHWCQTQAASGTNTNVIWGLEYSFCPINAAFAPTTTIYVTNGVSGTNWFHQIAELPTITQATNGISSIMVGRLFRGGSMTGDTYGYNATLLGFDVHFRKDGLGSVNEYSK